MNPTDYDLPHSEWRKGQHDTVQKYLSIERGKVSDVSFSLGMKILNLPSHPFHRQIEITVSRRIFVDAQLAPEIQWLNLEGVYTESSCQGPPPTALIIPSSKRKAEEMGYIPKYQEDVGLYQIRLKGGLKWNV